MVFYYEEKHLYLPYELHSYCKILFLVTKNYLFHFNRRWLEIGCEEVSNVSTPPPPSIAANMPPNANGANSSPHNIPTSLPQVANGNISTDSTCPRVTINNATPRVAYIACTRRNNETMAEFLSALQAENLEYLLVYQATLDTESAVFVYNEFYIPVKIYKITIK